MEELDAPFGTAPESPGPKDILDEEGFGTSYTAIDQLFEDEYEDAVEEERQAAGDNTAHIELKDELLEYIELVDNIVLLTRSDRHP